MYTYTLRSGKTSRSFQCSISFLQGIYSAWLFSAATVLKPDIKYNIIGELSNGGFDKYMVSIVGEKEYPDVGEHVHIHECHVEDIAVRCLLPRDVPETFQTPVRNPRVFCLSLPYEYEEKPLTAVPYHVVGNFDSVLPYSTSDSDSCKFALGLTPSARNTFILKIPVTADRNEFLQGFISLYRWHVQDSARRRVRTYDIPDLYLYEFESEVILSYGSIPEPKLTSVIRITE